MDYNPLPPAIIEKIDSEVRARAEQNLKYLDPEYQSIDTAPRDGTVFLGISLGGSGKPNITWYEKGSFWILLENQESFSGPPEEKFAKPHRWPWVTRWKPIKSAFRPRQ